MTQSHRCAKFRRLAHEGEWKDDGDFRTREIQAIFVCAECGRERHRRFNKLLRVEKEARARSTIPADSSLRRLALTIVQYCRDRDIVSASRLLKRFTELNVESKLERLAAIGVVRLLYRPSNGILRLHSVQVLDNPGLAEFASPGVRARRVAALEQTRDAVRALTHPEASVIRDLLAADGASRMDERVLRSLAALAKLVDSGEVLPARAFSAMALGNSKSFAPIRRRVEELVGPVERLGVRDSASLAVMGGKGTFRLLNGDLDVSLYKCIAISSEDLTAIRDVQMPTGGVLIIENMTPFQACLQSLNADCDLFVLWSGGFPNRGVARIVMEAALRRVPIRVWCDLDLGGVRIAMLDTIHPHAEFFFSYTDFGATLFRSVT